MKAHIAALALPLVIACSDDCGCANVPPSGIPGSAAIGNLTSAELDKLCRYVQRQVTEKSSPVCSGAVLDEVELDACLRATRGNDGSGAPCGLLTVRDVESSLVGNACDLVELHSESSCVGIVVHAKASDAGA